MIIFMLRLHSFLRHLSFALVGQGPQHLNHLIFLTLGHEPFATISKSLQAKSHLLTTHK